MSKNFKKLLLDIYPKPMPAQKKMVVETHEKWMGDELKQLDDIIVFGLKIL
ncbi:MAG: hypothetical protein IKP73_01215 [Bacteroidales bacterium]|nr:hypothetical protein [Bacteroidales bacterium]